MTITSAANIPSILIGDYFIIPKAHALFKPNENEIVIKCLSRRVQVLGDGMIDDDILKMLYLDEDDVTITTFFSTHLRTKCMYLKCVYENAIKFMNDRTWLQCYCLVVDVLADNISKGFSSARIVMT